MFKSKDKQGLFIYTSKKAWNGRECAMWLDDCDNNHKAEIIKDLQNINIDILTMITTARINKKIIYGQCLRHTIPNDILRLCKELRYCYKIHNHILIIRKKPIITEKGIKEIFKGIYIQ